MKRPVPVLSTASDEELIARLQLTRSNYEGPTGIVGVLHDAVAHADAFGPHHLAIVVEGEARRNEEKIPEQRAEGGEKKRWPPT